MEPLQASLNNVIKPDTALVNKLENVDIVEKSKEVITTIATTPPKEWLTTYLTDIIHFGLRVLAALVIFIIGRWIIRIIDRALDRTFTRRNVERSVAQFLRQLIRFTLYIILFVVVIGQLGVKTTAFAAILAALAFAIGMAMSGALQNFAGGIQLMMNRPFKAGDYIATQGFEGRVKEIKLSLTHIVTYDNKAVYLPNGALASSTVINHSSEQKRRIDWKFQISYGNDMDYIKSRILAMANSDERLIKEPAPFMSIDSFGDSGVNVLLRCWVKVEDYWDLYYKFNESIYRIITDDHNVDFPFPQLDVKIKE